MKLNKLRIQANEKGFTLIELMIVIAIIGILAAIAIPNFITYRDKAFCTSAEKDAASLQGALSNYFSVAQNTSYSSSNHNVNVTANPVIFGSNANPEYVNMSGLNVGQVVPTSNGFRISVMDGSGRCPESYSGPNENWGTTASGVGTGITGPWYSVEME
jgi:prepilin-type N-terminal cleavage/methylation domain-containing protein